MKTILYADDSVSLRGLVDAALINAGYKVILAEDGEEALLKLSPEVDLVVTDYNMPKKDGIEVIRGVRKDPLHKVTPILLLTTEFEEEMKIEAKGAGATGWVVKPFQEEKLIATIRKLLR
tara:strand:- start:1651 stop:2010 length:360 start_codon:yes stop_codon:yes gene_type:complete